MTRKRRAQNSLIAMGVSRAAPRCRSQRRGERRCPLQPPQGGRALGEAGTCQGQGIEASKGLNAGPWCPGCDPQPPVAAATPCCSPVLGRSTASGRDSASLSSALSCSSGALPVACSPHCAWPCHVLACGQTAPPVRSPGSCLCTRAVQAQLSPPVCPGRGPWAPGRCHAQGCH